MSPRIREEKKDDSYKLLCSWGIHFYSKKVLFESKDARIKFMIPICPHCECPKRKYMKLFFPDGRIVMDKKIYNRLISVLKDSKIKLCGFPGVRVLSDALKDILESLE